MTASSPAVVVFGSLHYDIIVKGPARPRKGETVTGSAWNPACGGKGGNQAVSAAKAGVRSATPYSDNVEICSGVPVMMPATRTRVFASSPISNTIYDAFRFVTTVAIEQWLKYPKLTINGASKASAMTGWRIG